MSPYGDVDWVRNLRKAGRGTLTRRGREAQVVATELQQSEAAPILRAAMRRIRSNRVASATLGRRIEALFSTASDAPLSDWQAEAERHPVFRLTPAFTDRG